MNRAKKFSIGELVHIPASVQLTQYEDHAPADTPIAKKHRLSDAPTLGVVVSNSGPLHLDVYCHGERWSIPTQSVYKLEVNKND